MRPRRSWPGWSGMGFLLPLASRLMLPGVPSGATARAWTAGGIATAGSRPAGRAPRDRAARARGPMRRMDLEAGLGRRMQQVRMPRTGAACRRIETSARRARRSPTGATGRDPQRTPSVHGSAVARSTTSLPIRPLQRAGSRSSGDLSHRTTVRAIRRRGRRGSRAAIRSAGPRGRGPPAGRITPNGSLRLRDGRDVGVVDRADVVRAGRPAARRGRSRSRARPRAPRRAVTTM